MSKTPIFSNRTPMRVSIEKREYQKNADTEAFALEIMHLEGVTLTSEQEVATFIHRMRTEFYPLYQLLCEQSGRKVAPIDELLAKLEKEEAIAFDPFNDDHQR